MKSDKGLARAIHIYKYVASFEKIFVLWMKDEIRYVTDKNLLTEMMKYKPVKITRIK